MVDCRSLIEFCRHHRNSDHHRHTSTTTRNTNSLCDLSLFAAIDILLLLMVLTSLGVLALPYLAFIFHQAAALVPLLSLLIPHLIYNAYALALFVALLLLLLVWEIISHKSRKCGKPYCRGLRKSVEFDIQLESQRSLNSMPPPPPYYYQPLQPPLDIGDHHKELEAELKRMAPLNGRTVLIFRTPCGCPTGRMEVWGAKKIRRINKPVCRSSGRRSTCTRSTGVGSDQGRF